MDAAGCVPLLGGAVAGATSCPEAGIITAAANVTDKRKTRCLYMATTLFCLVLREDFVMLFREHTNAIPISGGHKVADVIRT